MRDPESFARVYDEHVWLVYGFLAYRCGSREEAEDLTQLTFERALRAWDRFDEARASPATWLTAIARNALIDHYRKDRSGHEEPIADEDALGHDHLPESSLGLEPDLEAALAQLGDRERELIALRYGADLTTAQIAEMTDLSVANVQQILSRTLRALRDRLEANQPILNDQA